MTHSTTHLSSTVRPQKHYSKSGFTAKLYEFKFKLKFNCLTFVKILCRLKKRQNQLNFKTSTVVCKIKQGVNYQLMDYKSFWALIYFWICPK